MDLRPPDDFKTSPDDVMAKIKRNHKKARQRDRALSARLDKLGSKFKSLYLQISGLSALIIGDIVARYISSK